MLILADPRDDITSSDVSTFMGQVIAKDALSVNGAKATQAKSAVIEEISHTVLF